jgi:hypothetical protein
VDEDIAEARVVSLYRKGCPKNPEN